MMAESKKAETSLPWFSLAGQNDDVVLSTKIRLSRNLADFPFPVKMTQDDMERVNSLVYDAIQPDESFHFIDYKNIFSQGRQVLMDKNIVTDEKDFDCTAVILNDDDSKNILVNHVDHIRISNFSSGFETEKTMSEIYKVDELLQEKLQFAASRDFGYLTSHIKDCGSGLKISVRLFIPSIVLSGQFDSIISMVTEKKLCISPVFQVSDSANFSNFIFDLYPGNSSEGTELDQVACITSIATIILKTERKIRTTFADNNPTILLNFVKRAYAKAMYSLLLTYEEAADIISVIKFGLQTGRVSGIQNQDLNALYYRAKHGHILYVNDNYAFSYEEDLKKDLSAQLQRLRAIVIQQAFEKLTVN